jgi:hypothetical protein
MKTLQELHAKLTTSEIEMLSEIVGYYTFDDNVCYQQPLTSSQKGVLGSLIKKGLVYDSFISESGEGYESNFFPCDEVLDIYGLKHY